MPINYCLICISSISGSILIIIESNVMSVTATSNEYFYKSNINNRCSMIWQESNEWIRPCTPDSQVKLLEPKTPKKPQRNIELNGSSQRRISKAKRSIAADLNAVINRYQFMKSLSRTSIIGAHR